MTRNDEALVSYFSKIEDELLTREQERELAKRKERGDQEAREKLIKHNLRLVISIAKKYKNSTSGVDFMDLIAAGNEGLIKAVDKFDWRKGFRLSTYATWWIRQRVFKTLDDESRTVRIPAHRITLARKIRREEQRQAEDLTNEELAERLDASVEEIKVTKKARQSTSSLDQPLEQGGGTTKADLYAVDSQEVDESSERELREKLKEVMDQELTDREKQIVKLRFGLEDYEFRTLEETGEVFGISRERVRQLQNRAIEKLKVPEIKKELENLRPY